MNKSLNEITNAWSLPLNIRPHRRWILEVDGARDCRKVRIFPERSTRQTLRLDFLVSYWNILRTARSEVGFPRQTATGVADRRTKLDCLLWRDHAEFSNADSTTFGSRVGYRR